MQTSREKAIYLLNEIIAIQNYIEGFALEDYAKKEHTQHIQKEAQKIMEFMFKGKYGNSNDAASNVLQLILIKKLSEPKMAPEKLMEFGNTLLPKTRVTLESTIAEMLRCGDEEVEEDPDKQKPINPLSN